MRSKIGAGIAAGLIAGVVFGTVMQLMTTPGPMGRMPMIVMMARVVRSESLVVGWLYVLISSAAAGAIFGLLLGGRVSRIRRGLVWGVLYGVLLWLVGALILMPMLLGMDPFAPLTMAPMRSAALVSLGAHLLAGLILGAAFARLHGREPAASPP